MPRKTEPPAADAPRTDLEPERKPYDEGHFGTEEEEGVVREVEEESGEVPRRDAGDEAARRDAAEDSAGGDRGIE
jgi:hypothetical protein